MRLPLLMLAAAISAPAGAQSTQDTAALDAIVAQFVGVPIGQPGGAGAAVDPRMRLAACPAGPLASWFGSARQSVKLECPVPGGWIVYVPLLTPAAGAPVIARGDLVAVELRGRGFALSARGEALAPGAPGMAIPVRLAGQDRANRGVTATVIAPGKVGIELP